MNINKLWPFFLYVSIFTSSLWYEHFNNGTLEEDEITAIQKIFLIKQQVYTNCTAPAALILC